MRKYCAFDLEIARPLPDGIDDWKANRPLGITCAATLAGDGEVKTWFGEEPGGAPADRMSQAEASRLVDYLRSQTEAGYVLLTWNGLGFDFDILAEESGRLGDCRTLAQAHVDMMFHVFCLKGFGVALDRAAQGMNLPGKLSGLTGADAPRLWADGQRQLILDYVAQDVRTTMAVALKAEQQRQLSWISAAGRLQYLPLPNGWLTAEDAAILPLPNTSGLRNPWPRSKFTGWLKDVGDRAR